MGGQVVVVGDLPRGVIVVALVQAEVQRLVEERLRALDRHGVEGRLKQLVVGHVGARDGEAEGQPAGTTERLVPSLPRSVGLGPVFFPHPRAPWSSPRRPTATPSRSRRPRRRPAVPGARTRGTLPLPPTR